MHASLCDRIDMTGSCNWTTYLTTGCLLSWQPPHPRLRGLSLQLAVRECNSSGGGLPYVSLSCTGGVCDQLLKPCHRDADWCVPLCSFLR